MHTQNMTVALPAESIASSDPPSAGKLSPEVYVSLPSLALRGPDITQKLSEEELKEWLWNRHKDQLLSQLKVSHTTEHSELERTTKQLRLLDHVAQVQRKYLQSEGPKKVYGLLLEGLLDSTRSEYGFIGEVKHEDDGTPYVQVSSRFRSPRGRQHVFL